MAMMNNSAQPITSKMVANSFANFCTLLRCLWCIVIAMGHVALLSDSVALALQFARSSDVAIVPMDFPQLVAFYETHVLVTAIDSDDLKLHVGLPRFFFRDATIHNYTSMKIALRPSPSGYGVQLYRTDDAVADTNAVDFVDGQEVKVCTSWKGRSKSTPCLQVTVTVPPTGIDLCLSASSMCYGGSDDDDNGQEPLSLEILDGCPAPQDVVTLHQPSFAVACPKLMPPRYNYAHPADMTSPMMQTTDRGKLVLTASSNVEDYSEVDKNFNFAVGCNVTTADGISHSLIRRGTLRVTHANDHGPEPSEPTTIIINNTKDFTYKILSVRDHDRQPSPYSIELIEDRLNLFTLIVNKKRYIQSINAWLISAMLQPKSPDTLDLPTNSYTTRVRFVDTTLRTSNLSSDHEVIYTINFVKPGYKQTANPTVLSNLNGSKFEAFVQRNAAIGSRLLQPIDANMTFHAGVVFHLEQPNASDRPLPFNVTPSEGIIYVNDTELLKASDAADSIVFILVWTTTSSSGSGSGSSSSSGKPPATESSNIVPPLGHLSISTRIITDLGGQSSRGNSSCGDSSTWKDHDVMCSMSGTEASCDMSCGVVGAANGRCQWRNATQYRYATCSPDLITCPDKVCDELERTFYNICPQDCVETVQVHGAHFSSSQSHGISNGHGTCTCDQFRKCSCDVSQLKEDDDDVGGGGGRGSQWPSSSRAAAEAAAMDDLGRRRTDNDNISARRAAIGRDIDGDRRCGPTCIAITISVGTICAGAFVVVCMVILRRRNSICLGKWARSKYPNRDNSIPAVPSDYVVDDRVSSSATASSSGPTAASGAAMSNVILQDILSIANKNMEAIESQYEFSRHKLFLEQTLGEGEFGRVMRAKALEINGEVGFKTVAVKMSKSVGSSAEQDLLQEFNLLKGVKHPNVISVLGACSSCADGPLFIIVEYAEFGSLRVYLRKSRRLDFHSCTSDDSGVDSLAAASNNHQPSDYLVNPKDLLSFAWQISKGMAYLSEMKLVHRDLASRNILVAAGKVVKISDFGLTRDVYEGDAYFKKSTGRVPVKWMAIESLSDHVYTTKSDVWSFGIVLWEIITLGAAPYPGVPPEMLYRLLKSGYRMEKPDNCSEELYQIMKRCWHEAPQERPSFVELKRKLDDMLQANVEYLELAVNIVHNMTYFEDTTGQTDTVGEEYEMGYGSWNALPTDGSSDYLSANCRSSNADADADADGDGEEDEEVAFLLTDKSRSAANRPTVAAAAAAVDDNQQDTEHETSVL